MTASGNRAYRWGVQTLPTLEAAVFVWAAASFVGTDLSFLSFLKLYRTDVAERRVTTRRVVEPLDVVEHIGTGLFPGLVHLSGRALRSSVN